MIMKTNIPPFYVGQKVVYVTGIHMDKNSVHVVRYIHRDPCGCWHIWINNEVPRIFEPDGFYTHYECCNCGVVEMTAPCSRDCWSADSFKPIQELKAPMLTFEKIQQEEKEEILTLN